VTSKKLLRLERETGIEPATSSLGSWHSTAELLPLIPAGLQNSPYQWVLHFTQRIGEKNYRVVRFPEDSRCSQAQSTGVTVTLAASICKSYIVPAVSATAHGRSLG
jgi:hypothetical protein